MSRDAANYDQFHIIIHHWVHMETTHIVFVYQLGEEHHFLNNNIIVVWVLSKYNTPEKEMLSKRDTSEP